MVGAESPTIETPEVITDQPVPSGAPQVRIGSVWSICGKISINTNLSAGGAEIKVLREMEEPWWQKCLSCLSLCCSKCGACLCSGCCGSV